MSDEPNVGESTGEEPASEEVEAAEGGGVAVAVRDEATVPAVPMGEPGPDPYDEAKKTRVLLPFLVPVGAILTVAFFGLLNISRVFLAVSEDGKTVAVLVAAGITVAILGGATLIAALPEVRTSTLVIGMAGVAVVVMLAGSLVLGESLPKSEASAGFVEPKGPAINTLEVDALPEIRFQAKEFDVPAGINQIKYIDKGGTHTLVFDKNAQPGFELQVPAGKNAAKVELKEGQTYTIYCSIPGHRALGMQADIVVGPPGGTVQPGTQSPTQTTVPAGGQNPTQTTVPVGTPPGNPASQSSTGGS